MKSILKIFLVLLGLICLSLLIWFVGPLFAIGSFKPLEGRGIRWFLIGLLFGLWFLKILIDVWRAKNMNERLLSHMAARPAKDGDKAAPGGEQVEELHSRFDTALAELKRAKVGGAGKSGFLGSLSKQYIYQLPWYMFIGAPGSGKTTALSNSGLTFPLEDKFGKTALRGVGGTRSCEWWFTDEAVMLDTAGRYTTQESDAEVDKAEWQGFLSLLKKFRPRQPINGVLLTISVHDLLTKSADERHAQFLSFKTRLAELRETFSIKIPVYILVTKTDLLAGFSESFSSMNKEERAQVWGFTAPYDPQQQSIADFTAWYRDEFRLLLQRLNAGLPKLLQEEQDLGRRALIYSMPQQFAASWRRYLMRNFSSCRIQALPARRRRAGHRNSPTRSIRSWLEMRRLRRRSHPKRSAICPSSSWRRSRAFRPPTRSPSSCPAMAAGQASTKMWPRPWPPTALAWWVWIHFAISGPRGRRKDSPRTSSG